MSIAELGSSLDKRIEYIAELIVEHLQDSETGHCVRVNYLDLGEATAVCQFLRGHPGGVAEDLHTFLLAPRDVDVADTPSISADRAIELRNRKVGCLCLFVPSDLVDATASSIGNSFAEIDGRELHRSALQRVRDGLGTEARQRFQAINSELTGTSWVSDDQRLELALVVQDLETNETLDQLGLELWRVGLISDGRPDFTSELRRNRTYVRNLARPQRIGSSYRERIQGLGVTNETAERLEVFFAYQVLHDVKSWSFDLIDAGLTLDQWDFAESQSESDLESVEVQPLTDAKGVVRSRTKLHQKDGPGGALIAYAGEGKKVTVHWTTKPNKPREVDDWRIELVPSDSDSTGDDLGLLELPSRQVRGTQRKTDINLDFETQELPQTGFRIAVTAVDSSGAEIRNEQNEPITSSSEEFFILPGSEEEPVLGASTRRRTVDTLALGRLDAAVEAKGEQIEFDSPSWVSSGDRHYFSIKARPRTVINVELSNLLRDLEHRTLENPETGGRWRLHVDETAPVTDSSVFRLLEVSAAQDDAWPAFLKARRTMFERVRRDEIRFVLEAAEWNQDQLNGALNYAQAYISLLESLPSEDLHQALSIDTLHITIDRATNDEHAIVVLPTHPLRTAWFAVHASLLKSWEDQLLQMDSKRKQAIDLDLLRELAPLNTPPFIYSADHDAPFVFFQNLNAYFGVAFPPEVTDPARRMSDLAMILGVDQPDHGEDARRPHYLARQLQRYREGHSYADPIMLALVNSDRGEFLAGAIEEMFRHELTSDDDDDQSTLPSLDITAYVPKHRMTRLSDVDRVRALLSDQTSRQSTDALLPALSTSVRHHDLFAERALSPAHVAMVTDITQPAITAVDVDTLDDQGSTTGLSLYGLVARFLGTFRETDEGVAWSYVVSPQSATRGDPHPSGPRFGKVLPDTLASYLDAFGMTLTHNQSGRALPAVQIGFDRSMSRFLERIHRTSDWVITIDRFFGVEYYDSPDIDQLNDLSEKYLLDHSPEFSDGMSHRAIVTTVWRDEINTLLKRALNDLGFRSVDQSVRTLLHYLKLVSGRLALQASSPTTTGTAAMSLSAVVAWLKAQGRLSNSIVIPVDHHQGLFRANSKGVIQDGQRRCDLMLVSFRRGLVDATFVEVKWRRDSTGSLENVAEEMRVQMDVTARAFTDKFFNENRVDLALQRANLANTLRFYGRRSVRHGLMTPGTWDSMRTHIESLERSNVDVRTAHEGFIVNLNRLKMSPIVDGNTTIRVLTAQDFEDVSPELVRGAELPAEPALGEDSTTEDVAAKHAQEEPGEPADSDQEALEPSNQHDTGNLPDQPQPPEEEVSLGDEDSNVQDGKSPIEVVLGTSLSGDVTWRPSVSGSPHLFVTGIPGQGKSWTIINILNQLAGDDVPALVFDFHGQFGEDGATYVNSEKPQFINAAYGLPFSPFETDESSMRTNWKATAMGVSEVFGYVCGLGEIQQDVLYQSIRDAYRSCGFGDEHSDVSEYPSLENVLNRIERLERESRTQNLTARLRPLFEMDIFHHDPEDQVDLIKTIMSGLVIELHELPSETLQLMASAFVLRKIYRDMFRWGVADRLRLVIVLDEAHRLARDVTLPKLMKEGRKFGIAVVVASQGLADFHPDVVNNAGTKIAFRANHNESRKIAGFFRMSAGQDGQQILESLQVGRALVQSPEMEAAVRTQMSSLSG